MGHLHRDASGPEGGSPAAVPTLRWPRTPPVWPLHGPCAAAGGGGPGRCWRSGTRDLPPRLRSTEPWTHRYPLPSCSDLPAYNVGILVLYTCRCGPGTLVLVRSDSDRERGALLCSGAVQNQSLCRTQLPTARPSHPTPRILDLWVQYNTQVAEQLRLISNTMMGP